MAEALKTSLDQISGQANENLEALRNNRYPGRGIAVGKTAAGQVAVVYWVEGRSPGSQNRTAEQGEGVQGPGARVEIFDWDLVGPKDDLNLIRYRAMAQQDNIHVVSNGDQTNTVIRALIERRDPVAALMTRTYEPDWPNTTPRITSLVDMRDDTQPYWMAVTRRADWQMQPGNADELQPAPAVTLWPGELRKQPSGFASVIHTYEKNGDPLPSFSRDPYPVPLAGNGEESADLLWGALDSEYRVALVVKTISDSGIVDYAFRNQLEVQEAA